MKIYIDRSRKHLLADILLVGTKMYIQTTHNRPPYKEITRFSFNTNITKF